MFETANSSCKPCTPGLCQVPLERGSSEPARPAARLHQAGLLHSASQPAPPRPARHSPGGTPTRGAPLPAAQHCTRLLLPPQHTPAPGLPARDGCPRRHSQRAAGRSGALLKWWSMSWSCISGLLSCRQGLPPTRPCGKTSSALPSAWRPKLL